MTITAGTAQSNNGIVASFIFAHRINNYWLTLFPRVLVAEVTEVTPFVATEGHNRRFLVITGF
jgi:hypothetical protein